MIIYFLIPFHKYFVNEIPHFLGTFMNSSITNCGEDIKHDLLLRRHIHTLCDVRPLPTLDVSMFHYFNKLNFLRGRHLYCGLALSSYETFIEQFRNIWSSVVVTITSDRGRHSYDIITGNIDNWGCAIVWSPYRAVDLCFLDRNAQYLYNLAQCLLQMFSFLHIEQPRHNTVSKISFGQQISKHPPRTGGPRKSHLLNINWRGF